MKLSKIHRRLVLDWLELLADELRSGQHKCLFTQLQIYYKQWFIQVWSIFPDLCAQNDPLLLIFHFY